MFCVIHYLYNFKTFLYAQILNYTTVTVALTVLRSLKQKRQSLLKAKYCPRAMPVQHFVNPGRLVQAVSRTHKNTHKKPVWPWPLTSDLDVQSVSRGCRRTCSCKISSSYECSGSWAIVLAEKEEKLCDDAENYTAVASARTAITSSK